MILSYIIIEGFQLNPKILLTLVLITCYLFQIMLNNCLKYFCINLQKEFNH